MHDGDLHESFMDLEGILAPNSEEILIEGPVDLENFFTHLHGVAKQGVPQHVLMGQVGRMRVSDHAAMNTHLRANLSRLSRVSRAVSHFAGQIQADYLRRPNQVCGMQTQVLNASGGGGINTQPFTISPSNGQAWWRLLAFCCDDTQSTRFGFTSLKIALEHVNFAQTLPVGGSVVANGVPWAGFQIKESSHQMNLAPWTGTDFDNTVNITGTVANLTVAGSADAANAAARMWIPVQTDPCGQNYAAAKGSALAYQANLSRAMQHFVMHR
jgi:hypothetical protein